MRKALATACLVLLTACHKAPELPAELSAPAPASETASETTAEPELPDVLPRSMKGYALYGYVKNGSPYFTLVTATNRLKTFAELDAAEAIISDDGWVRVRVVGRERAADLLRRLPSDAHVMVASIRHVSVSQADVPADIGVPDEAALAALGRYPQ